jgi:DNA mismatch repair ATPase MutS
MKVIDMTSTAFGHRMLRKWVCFPITTRLGCVEAGDGDIDHEQESLLRLNERLDSVEDLIANHEVINLFRRRAFKLCDIERLLTQIYTYSV